jgi:TonB family protein
MRRIVLLLGLLSLAGVPTAAGAQALATAREGYLLVGARPSQAGQNEVWEIAQSRFDALKEWDPDTHPAPVTLEQAVRISQAWVGQRNSNVKSWATVNTALSRIIKGDVPTWRWYYQVLLRPESRLSSADVAADDVLVMVLFDGSVVEPAFQKAVPVLVPGTKDVFRAGNGVTEPKFVRQVPPHYTPEATRARVEGSVIVECVVNPNGKVSDAKVVQSLDKVFGLDAEAVRAVRQWRFAPGTLNGRSVKAVVRVPVRFQLTARR